MAAAEEHRLGTAVVWLSGNDVYDRLYGLPSFTDDSLRLRNGERRERRSTAARVAEHVLVPGPLRRMSGEMLGGRWERTSAYH